MAQDLPLRGYHFQTILKYFRTISGEENEAVIPWGDVGPQTQSPAACLTQQVPRDSAYSSDNEPSVETDDTEVPHWAAMGLEKFSRCGGAYVSLFCSQLPILKQRDYWKQNSVMFSTLQVYVSDVPIDQHGNVDTEPLYLTPDIVTGELYCSKTQLVYAPYHPAHLNRLEVNYVLCSQSQKPILPQNPDIVLFSPKWEFNYALSIPANSSADTVDVKFNPIPITTKANQQEDLPTIHCTAMATTDHNTRGPYNISIKTSNCTYWLYLEVTGSRVAVRAFRQDSPAKKPDKAQFNFQAALFP